MHLSGTAHLPRPSFASVAEYGARLGDAAYWRPYVAAVLARHGLREAEPEVGAVGSFPTFLAGPHAVKLFGELFLGAVCHATELSIHRLLLEVPDVPTPRLVAEGRLFGDDWPWPYLVTTRQEGTSWADARLHPAERAQVAGHLGAVVRRVHDLPPPPGVDWGRDWLAEFRADCVERHRRWGTLPAHLVAHIDAYLVAPSSRRRLVHADLHADHVFVDRGRLAGLIDWGDALHADPYYELPSLHLHTFGGDERLLGAFLDGYGWAVGSDFSRRAMSMTLQHQFDVLRALRGRIDLNEFARLDDLADRLWPG